MVYCELLLLFLSCRPESLGIVVGVVFLVLAIVFQYFNFTSDSNVSVFSYKSFLILVCCDCFSFHFLVFGRSALNVLVSFIYCLVSFKLRKYYLEFVSIIPLLF